MVQNVGARIIAMTGLTIRASEPVEIGFRVCAAVLFAMWWLYAVIQSYRRARVAARLVNMPGETFGEYLLGTAGTVVVAWCLIAIVGALNSLGRMLIAALGDYMPHPIAVVAGVAHRARHLQALRPRALRLPGLARHLGVGRRSGARLPWPRPLAARYCPGQRRRGHGTHPRLLRHAHGRGGH